MVKIITDIVINPPQEFMESDLSQVIDQMPH